jgi:acyl-CoA dehydrogenase
VLRAIGYWSAPLALSETMLASLLLTRAGLEVPEGQITLIQIGRLGDLSLSEDGRLNGRTSNVPWAGSCRWAAVGDAAGGLALVDLRQAPVILKAGSNFAGEERDTLHFANAPVHAFGKLQLANIAETLWLFGALIRSCMLVGALESSLDKAVSYGNERSQFGKTFGKFQAIQQQLAQMAGATSAARMATQVALRSACQVVAEAGDSRCLAFDVAVAKVCAGEAATLTTSVAHQVHGAIGFTHEHTLHFATRRLWSWRDEFGSDAQWAEVLGKAVIATGGDGFWAGLTERRL